MSLLGKYIGRREAGALSLLDELLARAAEFSDPTRDKFEDLIVYWELKRLS